MVSIFASQHFLRRPIITPLDDGPVIGMRPPREHFERCVRGEALVLGGSADLSFDLSAGIRIEVFTGSSGRAGA